MFSQLLAVSTNQKQDFCIALLKINSQRFQNFLTTLVGIYPQRVVKYTGSKPLRAKMYSGNACGYSKRFAEFPQRAVVSVNQNNKQTNKKKRTNKLKKQKTKNKTKQTKQKTKKNK